MPLRRRAALLGLVVTATLLLLQRSSIRDFVDLRITYPLAFQFRSLVHRHPKLPPSVKIMVFDDATAIDIKAPLLSPGQWATYLAALKRQKPRIILIDQAFTLPFPDDEDTRRLRQVLGQGAPVVAGAFVTASPLVGREPMPLRTDDNALSSFTAEKTPEGAAEANPWPWLKVQAPGLPYGPNRAIFDGFAHVGHMNFENGYVRLLRRLDPGHVLPHLGLFVAGKIRLEGEGLTLDGTPVPVDGEGRTLVNFCDPASYWDQAFSMRNELRLAAAGSPLAHVRPGDVVLLYTNGLSGGTSLHDTPFGRVDGGHIMASLVNSVLTGQWLKPAGDERVLALLGVVAGAELALTTSSLAFWILLLICSGGAGLAGVALFAYSGLVVPWVWWLAGLVTAGLTIHVEKNRRLDRQAKMIMLALKGMVSPAKLQELVRQPQTLRVDASQQLVTLMFIDIVSFSATAERERPAVVFNHLKELLDILGQIIHDHGGVIDRTIGDGLLCFFGYSYLRSAPEAPSPREALRAAIAIQRHLEQRNKAAFASDKPVFPVRIGVHTAEVYIGDLGDENRLDFTVIGHGVNYAKRLESSCEPYRIMASDVTMSMLDNHKVMDSVLTSRRMIQVKHHEELYLAYELNPFALEPQKLEEAINLFQNFVGTSRREIRYPWPSSSPFQIRWRETTGRLHDFSLSGLAMELDTFLAKHVIIDIDLVPPSRSVVEELAAVGLNRLVVEVCWGRPSETGYLHGLQIKNLSKLQRQGLLAILRRSLAEETSRPDAA